MGMIIEPASKERTEQGADRARRAVYRKAAEASTEQR